MKQSSCKSLLSRAAAGVLALVVALPAVASAPVDVTVQNYLLRSEVAMMIYDEGGGDYARRAREVLAGMDAPMAEVLQQLAAKDAAAGAAQAESWRVLKGALAGGGEFGRGILATADYDANQHADFDDASQRLMAAIDKTFGLTGQSASPESRAYLLAARAMGTYVIIAASPFGSYANSFNNEDLDLGKLVPRVDAALAELSTKYAKDADKSQRLKRITAKWQFIRTTMLKVGQQATPFIVYKHGGDIVRELKAFN